MSLGDCDLTLRRYLTSAVDLVCFGLVTLGVLVARVGDYWTDSTRFSSSTTPTLAMVVAIGERRRTRPKRGSGGIGIFVSFEVTGDPQLLMRRNGSCFAPTADETS